MDICANKEAYLLAVLRQLRQDLGATAFLVADHWESDVCAIGIADPRNPRVLAYVSTWNHPEGRYYLSLELPGESDEVAKDACWIDVRGDDLDETQRATWIRQAAALPGWGKP